MGYPGYVGAVSGLGPGGRLPDRRVRGSGPRLRERYPSSPLWRAQSVGSPAALPPWNTSTRRLSPLGWPRACHRQSSLSTVHSNLPSGMASAQQAGLVIPAIVRGPPWSMVCSAGREPLTMHPTTAEQPTTGKSASGEGAARLGGGSGECLRRQACWLPAVVAFDRLSGRSRGQSKECNGCGSESQSEGGRSPQGQARLLECATAETAMGSSSRCSRCRRRRSQRTGGRHKNRRQRRGEEKENAPWRSRAALGEPARRDLGRE
jgi:hypothetical protein